jgi:hypothetical protein
VALFGVLDGQGEKSVNFKTKIKVKGKYNLKTLSSFSYYQSGQAETTVHETARKEYSTKSTYLQPGNRFWQSEEQRQNFSQKLELPMQGQVASQFCPKNSRYISNSVDNCDTQRENPTTGLSY